MFKYVMVLVSVLSVQSFATPAMGDHAFYRMKYELNGITMMGTYESEILAEGADGFQVRATIIFDGEKPDIQDQSVARTDLLDDHQITKYLRGCRAYGGVDSIYTEGSLKLRTCKIPKFDGNHNPMGEMQIALVPFGIASEVQVDASTKAVMTLELVSFKVARPNTRR